MARYIALIMIPFIMLGQLPPHSHAGFGVVEPDGHSARPHVHLHGVGHTHRHHADHADETALGSHEGVISPTAEHDSDAVYLVSSAQSVTRTAEALVFPAVATNWDAISTPLAVGLRSQCRSSDPPDRYASLPIYLLIASLRL